MRQGIRQPFITTQVISLGFATALLSLFQPLPSASAQQLTGPIIQGTSGTGTQKNDVQTLTRKPHRLIRKLQNPPVASVAPSPSGSSPINSMPTPPPSLQRDNAISQSKEPSSLNRSVGVTVPLASTSVAPSSATATGSSKAVTSTTGTIPLAAAGAGNSSTSSSGGAGGRSMKNLLREMPGLAQLISPPSAPVVSVNPAIGTSPTNFSFTATQGGNNPANQTLSLSNTGGGTLTWTASDNAPWLTLAPVSGTGNGTVTLTAATGTLTAGTHSGMITLSATGASPVNVPVTFTVTAAPVPPAIGTSPTNFSFTATQGGNNPANQTLSLSNTGGGTLTWTASDNAPWLTLAPVSGTGNGTVTLTAATGTLTAGTHSGMITLSATGASPVNVPVTFTVTAAPVPPAIGTSPTNFSFTATQGGNNPANQTLSLSNTGGGTLTWTASDNAPWLTLAPVSGTGNGTVTLTAATGTLTAGTHSGMITLSATGASPVNVPVTFTVTAAPVPPAIGTSPTNFSFTATQGGNNPANQTLSLSNTGGGTLTWTASDNAPWLTLAPVSGTGNGTVTLTAATGTLTAGTHSGMITLSATGASPVNVPVTFTVTAAPVPPAIGTSPTNFSFTATQGGSNPANQTLSLSNTGGGTLTWTASDNAPWLTLAPASGTGNGTVTLTAATGTLTAGTHSGMITLSATGASPVNVPVTFTVTAAPNIGLNPSSLSYTATQGAANPANQTVSLTTSGGTLNWTVSDDVSWLTVSPASGSSNSTLTASVNTAGLATGTLTGTITVSSTGASSKTIAVTLTVNAPMTSSATLLWNAGTESDLAGYKIYRATTSGGYGAPIATVQGNVTTYIAAGLQSGTTYFFVVTAYDSAGNESVSSNEVSKSIF